MDEKRVKEILGKQLELLAEVSKKCEDANGLLLLTVGMCALSGMATEIDPLKEFSCLESP